MLIDNTPHSKRNLVPQKRTSHQKQVINKVTYRKLNNGKIVKSVDEQYIRDDLPCGIKHCPLCGADEQGK